MPIEETNVANFRRSSVLINPSANILWKNGMCGLRDHDCRARMEARQGRGGATRQQNNQTTEHQQDIGIS
jgi:hypothetical protein